MFIFYSFFNFFARFQNDFFFIRVSIFSFFCFFMFSRVVPHTANIFFVCSGFFVCYVFFVLLNSTVPSSTILNPLKHLTWSTVPVQAAEINTLYLPLEWGGTRVGAVESEQ